MQTLIIQIFKSLTILSVALFTLNGCEPINNIVPQLPVTKANNSTLPVGQDIARANALLNVGKRREAANAYFVAAQNYNSPERERLILQAAELAAIIKDPALTQQFLTPLNFDQLSLENQSRFRFTQSQLALNDRNYREALRILPQRIVGLPDELGQKILTTRMNAAQSSGDKLALIQELVLQEPNLKQAHEISLNHDRIWNHAQQIPSLQLDEALNKINHPVLKNWVGLARLSRISKYGTAQSKQNLRSDLGRWIQNNPNHPGMPKALGLLNAEPTTTVTPYTVAAPNPAAKPPIVKKPAGVKAAPKNVISKPITKPDVRTPATKPTVMKETEKRDPKIRSLYEEMKKQIKDL